ncbi:uncharacterized protein MELLADRAFT_110617 [Melampsora larici-populina 98AG31]|uniref:Uncharacterized protein n=1 Tax=Melampsora larici-populina (strain 98AG31 / pathotype 3-4-7) TaxID=747676 RepID=F4S0E1_MELLP|nr:uncharacterized protein MELLADRAFT_110617 [Melampsora larici-populina 98AG31]EGG01949.1 hypothetical protein MELLADRAFT_110617 [Melampsora larici-populina 98AG31]
MLVHPVQAEKPYPTQLVFARRINPQKMSRRFHCSTTPGRGKLYNELKTLGINIINTSSRENTTRDAQNLQLRRVILTRRAHKNSQTTTLPSPGSIGPLSTPIGPVQDQMLGCNTPKKMIATYDFRTQQGGRKRRDSIESPTILLTEPITDAKRRRSAQPHAQSRRYSERLAHKRHSHLAHSEVPLRKSLLSSNIKKHVSFESRLLQD